MNGRIVIRLGRPLRRRLERQSRQTGDARYRTRLRVVLLYDEGWGAHRIAKALGCAAATAVRVIGRFLELGEEGLLDGRRENGVAKVDEDLLQLLAETLAKSPQDEGWKRPTWTRELLARSITQTSGTRVSVTTISRMLERLGARWGCAKPVVACPWAEDRKLSRLRAIKRRLRSLGEREVAYYEDEVDIHLNPRIGRDWMLRGQQKVVVTPGQNVKRYIAGALALDGSDLVVVQARRKNTDLFLKLLSALRRKHPDARRIHIVLDNFGIHSSRRARTYLDESRGLFELHLLPPYTPDHNRIERLWRELHANVTRNHRCGNIGELMGEVTGYLRAEARRRRRRRATLRPLRPGYRRAA